MVVNSLLRFRQEAVSWLRRRRSLHLRTLGAVGVLATGLNIGFPAIADSSEFAVAESRRLVNLNDGHHCLKGGTILQLIFDPESLDEDKPLQISTMEEAAIIRQVVLVYDSRQDIRTIMVSETNANDDRLKTTINVLKGQSQVVQLQSEVSLTSDAQTAYDLKFDIAGLVKDHRIEECSQTLRVDDYEMQATVGYWWDMASTMGNESGSDLVKSEDAISALRDFVAVVQNPGLYPPTFGALCKIEFPRILGWACHEIPHGELRWVEYDSQDCELWMSMGFPCDPSVLDLKTGSSNATSDTLTTEDKPQAPPGNDSASNTIGWRAEEYRDRNVVSELKQILAEQKVQVVRTSAGSDSRHLFLEVLTGTNESDVLRSLNSVANVFHLVRRLGSSNAPQAIELKITTDSGVSAGSFRLNQEDCERLATGHTSLKQFYVENLTF